MRFVLFAALAAATTYTGNPTLKFRVDRPQGDYVSGDATLDKLVVHHCGGGSTSYDLDTTFDPVVGLAVDIDAGDHCSAVLHWTGDVEVDGPSYTVAYSGSTTTLTFGTPIPEVMMSPCTVVSGAMSGGCPRLYAWVDED
jgi:hypothetical protein